MNDIEQKARDMVRKEDGHGYLNYDAALAALCRAIEQHEAFRQEVNNELREYFSSADFFPDCFHRFIILAPKPDSLVEILSELNWITAEAGFRAALEARGLEIREKNDD